MPLYNRQTKLQGRGNFAPGVEYYAGIKAPIPSAPSLPKSEAVFNIDLSRIGDAMIAAKDSETKLGIAAIEMEQNMRNAEKDRQLKLDIANMEDARTREMKDKDLAMQWQIASMKNATEREKMQQTKETSLKDQSKYYAQMELSTDEELRNWYIDRSSKKMSSMEWETKLNKKINEVALKYPGVSLQDLYTYAGSMGMKTGIGSDIQNSIEEEKKLKEKNWEIVYNVGDKMTPNATTAEEKYKRGLEFLNSYDEVNKVIAWENTPGTTDYEKATLNDIKNKNLDNQINSLVIPKLRQVEQELPRQEDPIAFWQATKMAIANELKSMYPTISPSEINTRLDILSANEGLDRTFENVKQYSKDNSEYAEQTLKYLKNSHNIDIMKKGNDIQRAAVAQNGMPFFTALPARTQEFLAETTLAETIGDLSDNFKWTDEKGQEQTGWKYTNTKGYTAYITDAEAYKYQQEHGFTNPRAAVYDYFSKAIKGISKSVENNSMLPADAETATKKVYSTLTGNPKLDNNFGWMNDPDYYQYSENIKRCVDSNKCTVNDLKAIADEVAKKKNIEPDYNLALQHSAVYKLGKAGIKDADFKQKANDMNPINLTGHDIALMTGHTEEEYQKNKSMWDNIRIKDTQMYYQTDKAGNIVIDYTQNGWFHVGTETLRDRRNDVASVLIKYLSPEEQLAWYKAEFGNLVEKKDANASWLKDFVTFLQDETIGTLAKADTAALSVVADLANSVGLDAKNIQEISSDLVQVSPKNITRTIGTLSTLPYNAVNKIAQYIVKNTIENKSPKESLSIIENVGNNIIKVNNVLGNWILDKLKDVKEFITEDVPAGIRILKDAYKDWFTFPAVDVKVEFVGDKQALPATISHDNRPMVPTKDGKGYSTELNMIVEYDGLHYIVPTIVDGKVLTEEEAADHFEKTGEHFGAYKTREEALKAERIQHDQTAKKYDPLWEKQK